MGIKRIASEGAVKKTAKLPPKRKVAARASAVEAPATGSIAGSNGITPRSTAPVTQSTIQLPRAEITSEVIAIRAYFLSERRRMNGEAGDSLADWLEAERQLVSEQR
jgi:hypothetical protein